MPRSQNMGLNIWRRTSDVFDHEQLAHNWARVDAHDHTGGRGLPIPTEGFADGAVTSAKLKSGIISLDPNYVAQTRTAIFWGSEHYPAGSSGSIALGPRGAAQSGFASSSIFWFDPNDYSITGKTTKLRLRVGLFTNGVLPGQGFTFQMVTPPTFAGTSGNKVSYASFGSAVTGSGVTILNATITSTTTAYTALSSEFNPPSAARCSIVVFPTAATAAGAVVGVNAELQVRWV